MYISYNFQKYTTLHHQGNEDPLCHFRFLLRLPQLDRNQQLDPFRAKPACQSERVVGTRFARVKAQKCREKVGEAGQRGEGRERQPLEWNEEGGRTRWCPPVFIARGLCLLGNRPSGLTSREKSVMGDVLREACTRLALLAGIDFGGTLSLSFRSTTCLGIKLYRPDRRYKHGGSEVQTMYNIMYTIRALLSLLL